jgi:hypothetical protein
VIGHRCALQFIVTDLVQPADTRHIELWFGLLTRETSPRRFG